MSIGPGHPLHQNLETIFQKVPPELRERMNRRQLPDDTPTDAPSDKSLIRLHKQVNRLLPREEKYVKCCKLNFILYRPRGKESTEVRKSQIKGKESENSYQELKRSQKGQAHTETESRYFTFLSLNL